MKHYFIYLTLWLIPVITVGQECDGPNLYNNCGECYIYPEGTPGIDCEHGSACYGPGGYWDVNVTTSTGFIFIDEISVFGEPPNYGISDGSSTGACPNQDCDMIAAKFNNIIVGWTHVYINESYGIVVPVNFNDFITIGAENHPLSGDMIQLEYYDARLEIVYTTLNYQIPVVPLAGYEMDNLIIDELVYDECCFVQDCNGICNGPSEQGNNYCCNPSEMDDNGNCWPDWPNLSCSNEGLCINYGPEMWFVASSTSQGFISIHPDGDFPPITFEGEDVVVNGIYNGYSTGGCPDENCDIIAAVYNNYVIGWSYCTIHESSGTITIPVNFNDYLTPGVSNCPNPYDNNVVTLSFYRASEGKIYNNQAELQVFPLSQVSISQLDIWERIYGCTNPQADNFNPESNTDDNSCYYLIPLSLNDGNNLIGLPGILENDNTMDFLDALNEDGFDVNFIIGQGVGTFDQNGEWSGNLNNLSPYSGYWLNADPVSDETVEFDELIENCTIYPTSDANNLLSFYWGGAESVQTLDALGGLENALEKINFIMGQGVILYNHDLQFNGNLNFLQQGKGYWVNLYDDIDFKWGFDNCENPPLVNFSKNENPLNSIPEELRFTQSTEQAFYFFEEIEGTEMGDILIAYCNDKLSGSSEWSGKFTAVPVMGKDLSHETVGLCEEGEIPEFKLYQIQSSQIIPLHSVENTIPGWSNFGIFLIDKVYAQTASIPDEFILHTVHPNPFNPTTTISYSLPIKTEIELTVYDISGRKSAELYSGKQKAGTHKLEWNAGHLPSGVYFVKLTAGEFSQIQKAVLVK